MPWRKRSGNNLIFDTATAATFLVKTKLSREAIHRKIVAKSIGALGSDVDTIFLTTA